MPLLEARDVTIRIPTEDGIVHAANAVSFTVDEGELFGVAGESGSGKSVLMQAITGLLPGAEISGEVLFQGRDLLKMSEKELRALRGKSIGMIFQDPLSSLHPYYTIGHQITEVIQAHENVSSQQARERATDMLERVGIEDAGSRIDDFPHQFSGGMRQRVMIAMALVLRPPLVIADEPTTALDVTVQAQIVDLLDDMRRELGIAVIMITHDLGLLASLADRAMVMYAGTRLESGPTSGLFKAPAHPYTQGLLLSSPSGENNETALTPISGTPPSLLAAPKGCVFASRCDQVTAQCRTERPPLRVFDDGAEALCHFDVKPPVRQDAKAHKFAAQRSGTPVVNAQNICLSYAMKSGFGKHRELSVLDGVSLSIWRGETVGLVGESGCGKSSLARVIAGLTPATDGQVSLDGTAIDTLGKAEWRALRRKVQIVFQDPFGSLNPRRRVGAIIGDPFRIHNEAAGAQRKSRVQELMELVGLNPEHYNRFPSEFSGGQRQRIGIARALALKPSLIILDEPVSALDVSIQAQILNLLKELQSELSLTYLFISHDLAVVRHVCDRIAVMDAGKIVESAPTDQIYATPKHAFTKELLGASLPPPIPNAHSTRTLLEVREATA